MSTPINATVVKAFDILDLFGPERAEITAEIVAGSFDMAHATAHRFLVTLAAAGILTPVRRGTYGPGLRLARLGRVAETMAPLLPQVLQTVDRLCNELGESVMACRYSPAGPVCVAVATADRPISVNIRVGTTLPMLNTAQGRLWLAGMADAERRNWARSQDVPEDTISALTPELNRIREAGCAWNCGDNEPDIAAVSAAVWHAGRIDLTLSVFGTLNRFDTPYMKKAQKLMTEAAQLLSS